LLGLEKPFAEQPRTRQPRTRSFGNDELQC
jgi:hypothetical protein